MVTHIIKQIIKHELISGASLVFIGGMAASLLNFFFNLFMTRNLSVSDYGVLASLISFMTLSTIPIGALLPTIIYFSASYFAKRDFAVVRGLFLQITKLATAIGIIVFVVYVIFRSQIAHFFNIADTSLMVPIALTVFIGFVGVANMPLLQAKLAFAFISFLMLVGSLSKLVIGVVFVMMGFSVRGAIWSLFIAGLIPYLVSFISLKFLFTRGSEVPRIGPRTLLSYGVPSMLGTFGLTSLITTDIIIVKHFLDPLSAGIYATLSLIGRVIFFFSAPIGTAMFPLIAQKHARKEDFHNTLRLSLVFVLLPSLAITVFYFLFPAFTIQFFSKKEESLAAVPFLGIFGVFISLYALLVILVNFYLSIKKTEVFIPIMLGAISQAVLLWVYHDTFLTIIIISLCITGLLLVLLLLYYWKLYAKGQKD